MARDLNVDKPIAVGQTAEGQTVKTNVSVSVDLSEGPLIGPGMASDHRDGTCSGFVYVYLDGSTVSLRSATAGPLRRLAETLVEAAGELDRLHEVTS